MGLSSHNNSITDLVDFLGSNNDEILNLSTEDEHRDGLMKSCKAKSPRTNIFQRMEIEAMENEITNEEEVMTLLQKERDGRHSFTTSSPVPLSLSSNSFNPSINKVGYEDNSSVMESGMTEVLGVLKLKIST